MTLGLVIYITRNYKSLPSLDSLVVIGAMSSYVRFFRGVCVRELEALSSFMETINGSSIRGFGEDKMCWIPSEDKGFMVNDYCRILVGPTIYGFPWRSIWK